MVDMSKFPAEAKEEDESKEERECVILSGDVTDMDSCAIPLDNIDKVNSSDVIPFPEGYLCTSFRLQCDSELCFHLVSLLMETSANKTRIPHFFILRY